MAALLLTDIVGFSALAIATRGVRWPASDWTIGSLVRLLRAS